MARETIISRFFDRVASDADQEVLHFFEGDEVYRVTWKEYGRQIRRYANWFRSLDIEKGDRLLLIMDSGLEFWYAFLGAEVIGAIPVAVSPPLVRFKTKAVIEKIAHVVRQSKAEWIVSREPYLELSEEIAKASEAGLLDATAIPDEIEPYEGDLDPHDVAFLQFSSGTTGKPKGIAIGQKAFIANVEALQKACNYGPGESWANWCPLYHDMGLLFSLAAQEAGMPLYFQSPISFISNPISWLRIIADENVTRTIAPNFAYSYCSHKIRDEQLEGLDLSNWKVAFTAAEPIKRATNEEFIERFAPYGVHDKIFTAAYGMAENTVIATASREEEKLPFRHLDHIDEANTAYIGDNAEVASVGYPVEGTKIRITDPDGNVLPEGHVGTIEVTGTSLMLGYMKEDGTLPRERKEEWWHNTGDLGFLDDGELFFCGRAKDIIIKAGQNIYPEFIEEALFDLPELRKGCVAATGLYNVETGTEDVAVFCEVKATPESLKDLRKKVFKNIFDRTGVRVDKIIFLTPRQIPKTTSGKIQRQKTGLLHEAGGLELYEPKPATA